MRKKKYISAIIGVLTATIIVVLPLLLLTHKHIQIKEKNGYIEKLWEDNLRIANEYQEQILIISETIMKNPKKFVIEDKHGARLHWSVANDEPNEVRESFYKICEELQYFFLATELPDEGNPIFIRYHNRYSGYGILYFPDNMSETRKNQLIDEWTSFGGTGEEITPNLYAYYQGLPYGV